MATSSCRIDLLQCGQVLQDSQAGQKDATIVFSNPTTCRHCRLHLLAPSWHTERVQSVVVDTPGGVVAHEPWRPGANCSCQSSVDKG